ncbi:MAG: pilus assembly protein PilM [Planctomycetota bacterium]
MFRSKDLLGIEIGNQQLKIIHLNSKNEILDWVSTDIRTMTDDAIADFIRNYIQDKKIKLVDVIGHIPPANTITKNIELPSTNPAEIKQIVKLQAGHYSPYSSEEIAIDYITIGVFRSGYTRIFLVIVNRDYIKHTYDIIERAGLKLKKIVLSLETISLWYKDRSNNNSLAILHMDADNSDFMVIRNEKPIFLRNIPIGEEQLLYDRQKYSPKLVEEMNHSLEAYQTEQLESLSKIIAIGSTARVIESLNLIKEKNKLSVDIEDNSKELNFSATIDKNKKTTAASIFNLAVSVIKYNKTQIDLTPEEVKLKEAVAEKSRDIIGLGILVFLIVILLVAILTQKILMKKVTLNKLAQVQQQYHTEAVDLKNKHRRLQELEKYFSRRTFALDVLTETHKCISIDIYLTNVRLEDKSQRLTIKGTANTNADIIQMMERLEKSPYFKNVKSSFASSRREQDPVKKTFKEVVDFEIVCGIEL